MNIVPGTYKAKAVNGALGVSQTGTEQVAVLFEIAEGPSAGQRITAYLYFTEKATDRALESLENCGWDGEKLSELRGLGSKDVEIVIAEEEYQGKTQLKVNWINAPGGRGMAMHHTMTPEEAVAFDRRMQGEMAKRKQARQQRAGAPTDFNFGANKKDGPPV